MTKKQKSFEDIEKIVERMERICEAMEGGKKKEIKPITLEKLREYFKACEWGDVPDVPHAIYAYMLMDGYTIKTKD